MALALPASMRVHLIDLQRADGTQYFWASHEGSFTSRLTGAAQIYKPWLKDLPTIKFTRSLTPDGGHFSIQNLSGNTIDREVAALLQANEFDGAYCVYRPWLVPDDAAEFEFHGFIEDQAISDADVQFRLVQLFQPADIPAHDFYQTKDCGKRYRSAVCGMRRGSLFVPLTVADIHTASSIGRSTLTMTPDLYKDEAVMIIVGTGAGQERYISTHTATAITPKTNFAPAPDGTSQFLVTGAGTLKLGVTLADIFSTTTIGKAGLGRGVNADQDQLAVIISGTGAWQERHITSNTATTYTVSPPWTVTPDGTSRFIVVYRICAKDFASCGTRGVQERYPGLIHLQAQTTIASALSDPVAPPDYAQVDFADVRLPKMGRR